MSGGSMNYLYTKVMDCEFPQSTPERVAFTRHLGFVAAALRAIEWEDSGDTGPEETKALIDACLNNRYGSTA